MNRLDIPTRLGSPTNASLQADIPVHRRIVSDRCADLEAAVRAMARLVTTPGRAGAEPGLPRRTHLSRADRSRRAGEHSR